jgi:hypothetical protein
MSAALSAHSGVISGSSWFSSCDTGSASLLSFRSAASAIQSYASESHKSEFSDASGKIEVAKTPETLAFRSVISMPAGAEIGFISALDLSLASQLIIEKYSEELGMASNTLSRMDIFVSQTLPILAVVIGAAWVMYTRLDDAIGDARLETKQDFKGVNELIETRFNRAEAKLDSLDGKMDQKLSAILQQVTDLRVRQTQTEDKR